MNRSFKNVWNAARGTWVAVSEVTAGRGKASRSGAIAIALAALALAVPLSSGAQTITASGDVTSTNAQTASPWDAGNQLIAGNTSAGSLTVSGGAQVTATGMSFGQSAGGNGTLTVDGAGSTLNQTSSNAAMFVGRVGGSSGSVLVENGGTVNSARTFIGFDGGTGSVTVTGAGSTWTDTDAWRIGYSDPGYAAATGTANIFNGGSVNSVKFVAVGLATGTGTLTVSGAGSTLTTLGDTGTQYGSTVYSGLYVGFGAGTGPAVGTVNLSNGGTITANQVNLGFDVANASGTLNIGAASGSAAVAPGTLNAPSVVFGVGTGTLNFNHTSTGYNFASAMSSSAGAGTATINQLAGVTNLTGDSGGFNGTTNVSGGTLGVTGKLGSTASTMNVANGTLAVSGGGVVAANQVSVGTSTGTSGHVTVDGAGSSLTGHNIAIGSAGTVGNSGTLDITNGGSVSSVGGTGGDALFVGYGGKGVVTVSGAGSTLTGNRSLFMGGGYLADGSATGSITVSNGGSLVTDRGSYVGFSNPGYAGSATITVTGAGSRWTESGQARIGYGNGATELGTLNVLNGATATTGDYAIVGLGTGGVGVVNVAGAGSTWNVASTTNSAGAGLILGYGVVTGAGVNSSGILTISNGGVVNAPVVHLGTDSGQASSGTLNIGAAAGVAPAAPGALNASSVVFNWASPVGGGTGALSTGTLNFNHTSTDGSYVFASAISGSGAGAVNQLAGTTVLTGANTYSLPTNVVGGTLRAGVAGTFSAPSAYTVGAAGTLDTAGYNQTVASLNNSGTVSLVSATPGSTLTVTGAYVGNGGVLRLGTVLGDSSSASDRLVLDGPGASASGNTNVQITNVGGLGALTTGNGINVITAQNGAITAANAFALNGGHVDAGAYEYRLYDGDAAGAGENWYLRSSVVVVPATPATPETPATPATPAVTRPTYRAEVPLYSALPSILRQGDLAMLSTLHRRVGDEASVGNPDSPAVTNTTRAWGRLIGGNTTVTQNGTTAPESRTSLGGFQTGVDLFANDQWNAGLYVGHLRSDANVNGVYGLNLYSAYAGSLRADTTYLGGYATWANKDGLYVDTVLQYGIQDITGTSVNALGASADGKSLTASVEVGQRFAMGSNWALEPQAQLIYNRQAVGSAWVGGLTSVTQDTANAVIGRLGVRVTGDFATGIGRLQPYARLNLWHGFKGTDTTSFVSPAAVTGFDNRIGYTSVEVAAGATLALTSTTSLYGEVGSLFHAGGQGRVKSSVQGSVGVKLRF